MSGKGIAAQVWAMLILGIIVIVLYFIADIITVLVVIPFLVVSLFAGVTPAVMFYVTIILMVIILGFVFRTAGFRRN